MSPTLPYLKSDAKELVDLINTTTEIEVDQPQSGGFYKRDAETTSPFISPNMFNDLMASSSENVQQFGGGEDSDDGSTIEIPSTSSGMHLEDGTSDSNNNNSNETTESDDEEDEKEDDDDDDDDENKKEKEKEKEKKKKKEEEKEDDDSQDGGYTSSSAHEGSLNESTVSIGNNNILSDSVDTSDIELYSIN